MIVYKPLCQWEAFSNDFWRLILDLHKFSAFVETKNDRKAAVSTVNYHFAAKIL